MRITFTRFAVFALIAALVVGFGASRAVLAQDAMQAKVACDADLILSLYTAEYHFDFAAVEDKMAMATDTSGAMMSHIDLTAYDYGQFAPLFDSMMSMMDSSMSMSMLDENTMTSVTDAMGMDQAALDQSMMGMAPSGSDAAMMTDLAPAKIDGEPAECTALRDELRHFYTALAYANTAMPAGQ
jgi:hypothetical protein